MILKEKVEDLTIEDIDQIKKKAKLMMIVLTLVCFFFIGLFSAMFKQMGIVGMIFGVIFVAFPIGVLIFVFVGTKRDLLNGKKRVLTGTITKKFEVTSRSSSKSGSTSTSYYLQMDYEKILVDFRDYQNIHEGDLVEAQLTMKGRTLIKITKMHDSANAKEYIKTGKLETPLQMRPHYERIVDLDDEDIDILKGRKNRAIIRFSIFHLISGYTLNYAIKIVFILTIGFGKISLSKDVISQTISLIIPMIVLGFIAWRFKVKIMPLIEEINARNKKIVETYIEDKLESNVKLLSGNWKETTNRGDFRYLVIENKKYEVSPKEYSIFEGGEVIFAHFTPASNLLLKIESKDDKSKFIHFRKKGI